MKSKTAAMDAFIAVFSEDHGTAQVLTMPSERDREIAMTYLRELQVEPIVRDLAIIAAREVANVLEANGLRAADYADTTDMPQQVAAAVKKKIGSEYFDAIFRDHLRNRG
jgi:hypothetical protein